MNLNDPRGEEALKPKSLREVTTSISQKAKGYESERISSWPSQRGTRIQENISTKFRMFWRRTPGGPQIKFCLGPPKGFGQHCRDVKRVFIQAETLQVHRQHE